MIPEYAPNMIMETALRLYGGNRRPSYEYATNRVAPLLLMTAAHESGGFRWRRQVNHQGRPLREGLGAYGLTQVEYLTVDYLLNEYLPQRPSLFERMKRLMVDWGLASWRDGPPAMATVYQIIQKPEGDILSYALGRVWYLTDPHPIPEDVHGMAKYAKDVYNTHLGSATPTMYFNAYERFKHVL